MQNGAEDDWLFFKPGAMHPANGAITTATIKALTCFDSVQAFIDKCRVRRLKITPQRAATYQIILQSEGHPTADEIYRIV